MEKIKVFLAVPTMGSIVDSQVTFIRDIQERYKDKIELIFPNKLVRRIFHDFARNALVEDFLDSGADIMWFLDSDVTPPTHIFDLITEHGDKWLLSGAVYPIFMIPPGQSSASIMFTAYNKADSGQYLPQAVVPHTGTGFVDGLATGCLLIKREVFTKHLPNVPYFKFSYDPKTCVMTEGEDFYFMRHANDKGLRFFTDYSMVCKHQKSVDLLEMNNYAIQYAKVTLDAYQRAIREQVRSRLADSPKPKTQLILPQWSR